MDNGVYRHARRSVPDSDARRGARSPKPRTLDKTIEHPLNYLQQKPDELEVRWLLNLAYMMVGKYPDGVPPRYLIPPSAFASAEDVGRFVDVAPQSRPERLRRRRAASIVDDLSGNGRFDVVTSNFYSCGPLHYFGNNGDGTFTERTAAAGLSDQVGGLNIVQTDYNNDGCKDILVLRGGWEVAQRNSLLKNNCNGTFTDVTVEAGLATTGHRHARPRSGPTSTTTAGSISSSATRTRRAQLFLNNGTERTSKTSRMQRRRRSARRSRRLSPPATTTTTASPISTCRTTTARTSSTTTITTTRSPTRRPRRGVPGAGPRIRRVVLRLRQRRLAGPLRHQLLHVDGRNRADVSGAAAQRPDDEAVPQPAATARSATSPPTSGSTRSSCRWASNFGDIDNDGFLDIYLGMGTPSYASLAPHVLLRNKAGRSSWTSRPRPAPANCTRATASPSPISTTTATRTSSRRSAAPRPATATRCGSSKTPGTATTGSREARRREEQPGRDRRADQGDGRERGGRNAAPSIARSRAADRLARRRSSSIIGLGKAARIDDIEIWWPATNTRQHFAVVEKNQAIEITELASDNRILERTPVRLGGAKRTYHDSACLPAAPVVAAGAAVSLTARPAAATGVRRHRAWS